MTTMGIENGGKVLRCDDCEKEVSRADAHIKQVAWEEKDGEDEWWVTCPACKKWNEDHGVEEEAERLFGGDDR